MFVKYDPTFKYQVIMANINGSSLEVINDSYGSNVSADSLYRWRTLYANTRAVLRDPNLYAKRGHPLRLNDDEREFIKEMVTANPAIYLAEIQQNIQDEFNIHLGLSTISTELRSRLNMSLKTLRKVHPNQNPVDRAQYISLMAHVSPDSIVFTDESGICLDGIARRRGWAPIGQRTPRVPHQRATHRFNLIPAVALSGLVAVMVQRETVTRFDFEYYLEHILFPMMNPFPGPRSILVLDNAAIHHGGRVDELADNAGVKIVYLPAYSPDLNPIEKGFSVLKASLRRFGEMTGGEEDGEIIESFARLVFTSDLMQGLFRGSGYMV